MYMYFPYKGMHTCIYYSNNVHILGVFFVYFSCGLCSDFWTPFSFSRLVHVFVNLEGREREGGRERERGREGRKEKERKG